MEIRHAHFLAFILIVLEVDFSLARQRDQARRQCRGVCVAKRVCLHPWLESLDRHPVIEPDHWQSNTRASHREYRRYAEGISSRRCVGSRETVSVLTSLIGERTESK